MNYRRFVQGWLLAGAVSVSCVGCLTPVGQCTASLNEADEDLPSTLGNRKGGDAKKLLAKADEVANNEIVSSPLQKQLSQLQKEATEQRAQLSQSQSQSEELQRRSQELRSNLQSTEAKIAKVEKVMRMINENPTALEGESLNAGGTLAMAGSSFNARNNNGFNLNDEDMPTLDNSAKTANRPAEKFAAADWGADNGANTLAPAADFAAPQIAEKPGAVWNAPAAPAKQPVKVILCDGEGVSANYVISRPAGEKMEKGMLFQADAENILVVTDVYATNAKARLHPRFAKGGVRDNAVLTAINALPE